MLCNFNLYIKKIIISVPMKEYFLFPIIMQTKLEVVFNHL